MLHGDRYFGIAIERGRSAGKEVDVAGGGARRPRKTIELVRPTVNDHIF